MKDTAEATNATGTAAIPVSLDLDGGFIVVSYANFGDATLLHDPEFGVTSSTSSIGGGGSSSGGDVTSGADRRFSCGLSAIF